VCGRGKSAEPCLQEPYVRATRSLWANEAPFQFFFFFFLFAREGEERGRGKEREKKREKKSSSVFFLLHSPYYPTPSVSAVTMPKTVSIAQAEIDAPTGEVRRG
jgi:hypothetical protein